MEVSLPWVLTYCSTELQRDPLLGLLSVFLTEWVAQVPSFFFREVYYPFHPWFILIKVRDMIRLLGPIVRTRVTVQSY